MTQGGSSEDPAFTFTGTQTGQLAVQALPGIPEVHQGDDIARLLLDALDRLGASLRDGDVLVVTSKIISKAQGRVVGSAQDPKRRELQRARLVEQETVRVVARRGDLVIGETTCGAVGANGGVDQSNSGDFDFILLPERPDEAAGELQRSLRAATGCTVGVVITDTLGRPWRRGVTDVAIGVSGLLALLDLRGTPDGDGRRLETSEIAVADEVAAAADLVKGKNSRNPAALVRGLKALLGSGTARDLLRPPAEDLFRVATGSEGLRDFIQSRRTHRFFLDAPVPKSLIEHAVVASATAAYPHHTRPLRIVHLASAAARARYLEAMEAAWRADLSRDGASEPTIHARLARSRELLGRAPVLLVPFLLPEGRHRYAVAEPGTTAASRDHRQDDEETMFVAAAGGGVATLLLGLHAEGLGAAWLSSSLFCWRSVCDALGVAGNWRPMGSIIAGWPDATRPHPPRPAVKLNEVLFVQ